MENTLAEEIEELVHLQRNISSKIESLENGDYSLLLTLRYMNFNTWEEVAEEMGFTFQWVHVIHKRALKAFEPLIQTERGEQIESKH